MAFVHWSPSPTGWGLFPDGNSDFWDMPTQPKQAPIHHCQTAERDGENVRWSKTILKWGERKNKISGEKILSSSVITIFDLQIGLLEIAQHALVLSVVTVLDTAKVGKCFKSSLQKTFSFLLLTHITLKGQVNYFEKYSYSNLKVDLFG